MHWLQNFRKTSQYPIKSFWIWWFFIYPCCKQATAAFLAVLIDTKNKVDCTRISAIIPAIMKSWYGISIREGKFFRYWLIPINASGQEMTIAKAMSRIYWIENSLSIALFDAPSVFLMPISGILCSDTNAIKPINPNMETRMARDVKRMSSLPVMMLSLYAASNVSFK